MNQNRLRNGKFGVQSTHQHILLNINDYHKK